MRAVHPRWGSCWAGGCCHLTVHPTCSRGDRCGESLWTALGGAVVQVRPPMFSLSRGSTMYCSRFQASRRTFAGQMQNSLQNTEIVKEQSLPCNIASYYLGSMATYEQQTNRVPCLKIHFIKFWNIKNHFLIGNCFFSSRFRKMLIELFLQRLEC